jgi:molybdate transport system ATP-binding protein
VLEAHLVRRLNGFTLDAGFQALAGATTVLVGESGAGKTTVLKLLAGLERLDRGTIQLGDDRYADAAAGFHLPAWRRQVGYVAQDYALFPHLSASDNVAFGLRAAGLGKRPARVRAEEALDRVGIPTLGGRMPAELSGGQQQRVALARALVLEPRMLLLDEPLSALDVQTRGAMRVELRDLLRRLSCCTIYVTHSPLEAVVFGDQIVVLDAGRVAQAGTREDLLRRPRSLFVAELVGTNLFVGRPASLVPTDAPMVRTPEGRVVLDDSVTGNTIYLTVNPREITLSRTAPEGSAQNVFEGPVREILPEGPEGERIRVVLGTRPGLVAEVTREGLAALGLEEGIRVFAAFKATGVRRYD